MPRQRYTTPETEELACMMACARDQLALGQSLVADITWIEFDLMVFDPQPNVSGLRTMRTQPSIFTADCLPRREEAGELGSRGGMDQDMVLDSSMIQCTVDMSVGERRLMPCVCLSARMGGRLDAT